MNKNRIRMKKTIVFILILVSIVSFAQDPITGFRDWEFGLALETVEYQLEKAKNMTGTRLLHIFSPCPPGHRSAESDSIKISRLAVESKVFPLYEVEHGSKYTLNHEPKGVPVTDYTSLQGRFRHLTKEELQQMQKRVDYEWDLLTKKISVFG